MTNVKLIIESLCESILISSNELRSILYKMRYSNDYANILFNMIYYNKDIKTNYNAISISDRNDEISFIPDSQHSKILQDGQDPWTKTKSKSKIGRAVRQILTSNGYTVTDSDIEKFVNSFKTAWDKEYAPKKIEIVKSDKIIYWYNEQNYSEEGGTRCRSWCCTRGRPRRGARCCSGSSTWGRWRRRSATRLTEGIRQTGKLRVVNHAIRAHTTL